MAISDKELKKICSEFRKGILCGEDSKMKCAMVTLPLRGYLKMIGVETCVIEGVFGDYNHLWLELPDGRVIDCTADQFNRRGCKYPKVYIGKPLDIHAEEIEHGRVA